MHVCFFTRDDADEIAGGDIVMIESLSQELGRLGIRTSRRSLKSWPPDEAVSVIHATFLYQPRAVEAAASWCKATGTPFFLSPLIDDPLDTWFDSSVQSRTHWRIMSRVLGYRRCRMLYRRRQYAKIKASSDFALQQELVSSCSHVITNSNWEGEWTRQWLGVPGLEFTVIPLGIDNDVFDPSRSSVGSPLPCGPGYVLQVSRIQLHKNQIRLIRALWNDPIDIVLSGTSVPHEPEYFADCSTLARQRGRVFLVGRTPFEYLPSLYQRAGVHVLASSSERPGLVSLEAAAMGCPVVATHGSPIGEYLSPYLTYCEHDDLGSIRHAVLSTLGSQRHAVELSARARAYSWARAAALLVAQYQQALSVH